MAIQKPKTSKKLVSSTQSPAISKKDEILEILALSKSGNLDKGSDEVLDRENEKKEFILGGLAVSITDLKLLIPQPQDHPYVFTKETEYYTQLQRILPEIGPVDQFFKHPKVGRITREIIYGRFSLDMIEKIEREFNPYIGNGMRRFWHYQFLNDYGLKILIDYIYEAVELMKKSSNYHEFRMSMLATYGIPYQLPIFDDNGKAL